MKSSTRCSANNGIVQFAGVDERRALFVFRLDVEVMKEAMDDRGKDDAEDKDQGQPGIERIKSREPHTGIRMYGCHRTHAGEDHGGVHKGGYPVHSFEFVVTNHSHGQGYQDESKTQRGTAGHATQKCAPREQWLMAMFEHNQSLKIGLGMETGMNRMSRMQRSIVASVMGLPLIVNAQGTSQGGALHQPTPRSLGRLCANDEQVVFACKTGEKAVSVCASREASRTSGYIQYRFGKPGSLEMTLPANRVIPPQSATGATETYSGGGAAWLRFRQGAYGYVVYTGIGRWGPKGETREVAGVVVEQPRVANNNLKCAGKVTSLLGPDWFGKVGIQRKSPGESFDLPVP